MNMKSTASQSIGALRKVATLKKRAAAFRSHRETLSPEKRAGERSAIMLDALPHARVRGVVVYRIENPKQKAAHAPSKSSVRNAKGIKALSAFEREDAHLLCAMACERLGIADGAFPAFSQWKTIFQVVRRGLGIDRKVKRDARIEILSLDPHLLAQVEVADIVATPEDVAADRARIAPFIRSLHSRLVAAFECDPSRKRRARFTQELRFLRSIAALKGGNVENARAFAKGASESALRKRSFDFRAYVARGTEEIELRARAWNESLDKCDAHAAKYAGAMLAQPFANL